MQNTPVKLCLAVVALLFFFCGTTQAQTGWDDAAKDFVATTSKNRYKYAVNEIRAAIEKNTSLINTYFSGASKKNLSALYQARANLYIYILEFGESKAEGVYTPPADTIAKIKADFLKAQMLCDDCQCRMFDNIVGFYSAYGTQAQLDSLEKVAVSMGRPTDHTYIGLDLDYMPQNSIASAGIGVLGAWTVRQPKRWVDASGKKYRKCSYDYPMALGLFFVGAETAFNNSGYNAFKFDPVWINYVFSAHPLQVLYADSKTGKTLIYRPELGISFSTFGINYAMNIPFNASFDAVPVHNLSIRFCIPTIRLN